MQQAHDALELKVQQRTADLQTNAALQQEVAERVQAEQTLRAAQDELVQAGKMAVIGQLSTEVAHELNEPLAALRALAGNSQRFLERGQTGVAQRNLQRMAELADRMGGLVISYAALRANQRVSRAVAVSSLIGLALAVLETRLKRSAAVVDCQGARTAASTVRCQPRAAGAGEFAGQCAGCHAGQQRTAHRDRL